VGMTRDELFQPAVPGGKHQLYRAAIARNGEVLEGASSALILYLRYLGSAPSEATNLAKCTNRELRECRKICQSLTTKLGNQAPSAASMSKLARSSTASFDSSVKGVNAAESDLVQILRMIDSKFNNEKTLKAHTVLGRSECQSICGAIIQRIDAKIHGGTAGNSRERSV